MKIYQLATSPQNGPIKLTVKVVDGETRVYLPGAPDILILREGKSVDISVSAPSPHAYGIVIMLDVDSVELAHS